MPSIWLPFVPQGRRDIFVVKYLPVPLRLSLSRKDEDWLNRRLFNGCRIQLLNDCCNDSYLKSKIISVYSVSVWPMDQKLVFMYKSTTIPPVVPSHNFRIWGSWSILYDFKSDGDSGPQSLWLLQYTYYYFTVCFRSLTIPKIIYTTSFRLERSMYVTPKITGKLLQWIRKTQR